MFQIIIIPRYSNATGAMFYKTEANAQSAHKNILEAQQGKLPTNVLVQKDDFGHIITIEVANICHVVYIDFAAEAELHALMGGAPQQPQKPKFTMEH